VRSIETSRDARQVPYEAGESAEAKYRKWLRWLLTSEKHPGVILITGPSGSGKTTLARAVGALLAAKHGDTIYPTVFSLYACMRCAPDGTQLGMHTVDRSGTPRRTAVFTPLTDLLDRIPRPATVVMDEVQYLREEQRSQLWAIAESNIVVATGIKTGDSGESIPCMEDISVLAHGVIELGVPCQRRGCQNWAEFNARCDLEGKTVHEGPSHHSATICRVHYEGERPGVDFENPEEQVYKAYLMEAATEAESDRRNTELLSVRAQAQKISRDARCSYAEAQLRMLRLAKAEDQDTIASLRELIAGCLSGRYMHGDIPC
jgi:thymidine kinase